MVDLVSAGAGRHSVGMLYGGEAQLQGVGVWASWGGRSSDPLDTLEDNTGGLYAIPPVLTEVE